MPEERLQKVMAHAGVASRRASELLISAGRVLVNGQVVREMGVKVDIDRDVIVVDGELLPTGIGRLYYLINKPVGILSTASDPYGRRTVVDLVEAPGRVYPVGRLDADSEGLILLTNDGEVTAQLTHPRHGFEKTYIVLVRGEPPMRALEALLAGVPLEEGIAKAADVLRITGIPDSAPGMSLTKPAGFSWLEVVMLEGHKHEVRRMFEQLGFPVQRLIRIGLGPLELGDLRSGESRPLSPAERRYLLEAMRTPLDRRAHAGGGVAKPGARRRPGRPPAKTRSTRAGASTRQSTRRSASTPRGHEEAGTPSRRPSGTNKSIRKR